MLTLFQEPRGQKIIIFADAQAALQRITSDVPGPGQRYALAIAQQAYDLWEQRRVSVQFPVAPQPCRHRRQREGRRACKDGSTERMRLRATATYHRAEVGRGMSMDGAALEQARVPTTEEDTARLDAGQS